MEDRPREIEAIEKAYHKTMANADSTFRLNLRINIIVVIIGIIILAYSIIYSWVNELNIYSTAFAGIGVAEFIAIFGFNPQKKIQEALANHTQVQIIYDRYLGQRFVITDMYSVYRMELSSVKLEVPE